MVRACALALAGLLVFALLPGCRCLSTADQGELDLASKELAVGDARGALERYRRLSESLSSKGCREAALARSREAVCLYQLGRFEEAAQAFAKVKPEDLDPEARKEAYLQRGHAEREIGRRLEPVFVADVPENSAERGRRVQDASTHYQLARNQYSLVLNELDSRNLEALLGSAECFLRLGSLSRSTQFFHKAGEILASSPDPKEKRVLFLQGRIVQEDLGNGELTLEAAEKLSNALLLDRDGNYDYHVAYRDLLLYLRRFRSPPELEKRFEGDSKLLRFVKALIERLDGYRRQGRRPDGEWGKELDANIAAYLKEYQGWENNKTGLKENVQRAYQVIRAGGEKVYLDAYREALKLLKDVDPAFQKEPEYIQTRKEIQQGFVEGHLKSGELLIEIGEWDLAEANLAEALSHCDRAYVTGVDQLLLKAQEAKQKLSVEKRWTSDRERVRALLSDGKFQEAQSQYELAKARYRPEDRPFLEDQFRELDSEVGKKEEIADLIRIYQQGLKAETPTRALELYTEALAKADKGGATYWKYKLRRQIAEVYYRLDDYQRCLDEMSELAKNLNQSKTPLNQNDYLLSAKSFFRRGDYEQAARNFDEVKDPASLDAAEAKMAGLAYLKQPTPNPNRARTFLERASLEDAEVRQGLKGCYRRLYEEWREKDRAVAMEALTSLTKLDPSEYEARKDLGLLLYEVGLESKDSEAFRAAYQHLRAAAQGGVVPRTEKEKQCFGRLVACYGKYMPLAVGNWWSYRVSDGNARTVSVTEKIGPGRYRVRIEEGGAAREEVWEQADEGRLLKRHNAQELITQQLPIQCSAPDHLPASDYSVLATQYSSKVVATGLQHVVGGKVYDNCIQIRISISSGTAGYRDLFFAPGVGEVEMKESSGIGYALNDKRLQGGEAAPGEAS